MDQMILLRSGKAARIRAAEQASRLVFSMIFSLKTYYGGNFDLISTAAVWLAVGTL
jgi:hypothetical protein